MSTLVDQTLLSNKKQQNTLIQFVKKGEKIGKNETQQGKEESSHQEGDKQVVEVVQCSVKNNISTNQPEQNSDCTTQGQLNHCSNNIEQGPKENFITLEKDTKQGDNVQDLISKTNPVSMAMNTEKHCAKISRCENESYGQQLSDEGTTNIDTTEKKSNSVWYTCPVCRDEVGCSDLNGFNHHIDTCLSKSVVKECSRYTPEDESPKSKKTPSRKTVTPKRKSSTSTPKLINSRFKTLQNLGNVKYHDTVVTVTQESVVTASALTDEPSTSKTQETNDTESSVEKLTKFRDGKVTETLVCPVCFMEQTGADLDAFNQHVDSCLCKGTITEILKEQKHSNKRLVFTVPFK